MEPNYYRLCYFNGTFSIYLCVLKFITLVCFERCSKSTHTRTNLYLSNNWLEFGIWMNSYAQFTWPYFSIFPLHCSSVSIIHGIYYEISSPINLENATRICYKHQQNRILMEKPWPWVEKMFVSFISINNAEQIEIDWLTREWRRDKNARESNRILWHKPQKSIYYNRIWSTRRIYCANAWDDYPDKRISFNEIWKCGYLNIWKKCFGSFVFR